MKGVFSRVASFVHCVFQFIPTDTCLICLQSMPSIVVVKLLKRPQLRTFWPWNAKLAVKLSLTSTAASPCDAADALLGSARGVANPVQTRLWHMIMSGHLNWLNWGWVHVGSLIFLGKIYIHTIDPIHCRWSHMTIQYHTGVHGYSVSICFNTVEPMVSMIRTLACFRDFSRFMDVSGPGHAPLHVITTSCMGQESSLKRHRGKEGWNVSTGSSQPVERGTRSMVKISSCEICEDTEIRWNSRHDSSIQQRTIAILSYVLMWTMESTRTSRIVLTHSMKGR